MNRKNMTMFQMVTRALDFGERNVISFPKSSAVAELLDQIKSGLKTWSEETAILVSAETEARNTLKARLDCRGKLQGYLLKAGKLSQITESEIVRPSAARTDQALIDVANAFLLKAPSLKKDFVRHGLPAQFADNVSEAVSELHEAVIEYGKAKAARSSAAGNLEKAMEETMTALRGFDFLVSNTFEGNPGVLASYASARFVPHARGRTAAKAEPASSTPAVSAPAPAA